MANKIAQIKNLIKQNGIDTHYNDWLIDKLIVLFNTNDRTIQQIADEITNEIKGFDF